MAKYSLSKKSEGLQAELQGASELMAELQLLAETNSRPMRLVKSTIRRAWKKAGAPIAAHAQQLAPKSNNAGPHMADKIKVSTTLSRRQRRLQGFGARGSTKSGDVVAYIGAGPRGPAVLAEFGTGPRYTKTGASRGVMPAQPFLRPAWESGKHRLQSEMIGVLSTEIAKTAERARKRQMKKAGIR